MIHGENRGQGFTFGQIHQRCIGEIHRPIRVATHQVTDGGQFIVRDRANMDRTRHDEVPDSDSTRGVVTDEMESFGKNGL